MINSIFYFIYAFDRARERFSFSSFVTSKWVNTHGEGVFGTYARLWWKKKQSLPWGAFKRDEEIQSR